VQENLDNEPYENLIKWDFLEKNEIHFFLFGPNFPVFLKSIQSEWDNETYLKSPLREAIEKLIALVDEYIDNAVLLGEVTISPNEIDRNLFTPYTPYAIPVKGDGYALIQVLTRLRAKNFPIQEGLTKDIERSRWQKSLSYIPELQNNMLALSKKIEDALSSGEVELQPIVDKYFKETSLRPDEAGKVGGDGAGAKPKQNWNRVKNAVLNVLESSDRTLKIVEIYNHPDVQKALIEGKPVTEKYVKIQISKWIKGVNSDIILISKQCLTE